jgi:hypothetical protein
VIDIHAEPALVIFVVDGKRRYVNERHKRENGETVEAFADRIRALIVKTLTK